MWIKVHNPHWASVAVYDLKAMIDDDEAFHTLIVFYDSRVDIRITNCSYCDQVLLFLFFTACELLGSGVIAIFGPTDRISAAAVEARCRAAKVPHIQARLT